jgi:hypothetical protein
MDIGFLQAFFNFLIYFTDSSLLLLGRIEDNMIWHSGYLALNWSMIFNKSKITLESSALSKSFVPQWKIRILGLVKTLLLMIS